MLSREFTHEGHTTRVTITRRETGWRVIEERDRKMIRDVTYSDWHRVERAIHAFEMAGATQVRKLPH